MKIYFTNQDPYQKIKEIIKTDYGFDAEIKKTKTGKPLLNNNLFMSLSHTNEISVFVISNEEVGIDIETIKEPNFKIAKRFFKINEQRYVFEKDSIKRFFEIWTKKEAYIKYHGTSLSELRKIDVLTDESNILKTYFFKNYVISICSKSKEKIKIIDTED